MQYLLHISNRGPKEWNGSNASRAALCFLWLVGCSGQVLDNVGNIGPTPDAIDPQTRWDTALDDAMQVSVLLSEAQRDQAEATFWSSQSKAQASQADVLYANDQITEADALMSEARESLAKAEQFAQAAKAKIDSMAASIADWRARIAQLDATYNERIQLHTELSAQVSSLQTQINEVRTLVALQTAPATVNRRVGVGASLWRKDPATGQSLYDFRLDHYTSTGLDLAIGWYVDWAAGSYQGYKPERRIEYKALVQGWGGAPVTAASVQSMVQANPERYPDGTMWMVGNEIGWDDARSPTSYVKAYCQSYQAIKSVNPTFKVSPGAIIPTAWLYFNETHTYKPGAPASMVTAPDGTSYEDKWRRANNRFHGINYMQEVLDRYRSGVGRNPTTGAEERFTECDALRGQSATLPTDAWLIHVYPMFDNVHGPMSDADRSVAIVRFTRAWMANNGYRALPLYIKEMGPGTLTKEQGGAVGPGAGNPLWYNKQYMEQTFDSFSTVTDANIGMPSDGNRLVQRWAWFVLNNVLSAQGGEDSWMSVALFDSITRQKVIHDQNSPVQLADVFVSKTRAHAEAPAMYRISMSGGNYGGVFQRLWVSPAREGKTVHFQAVASCTGDVKFYGWYITRYRRSDGAQVIADTDPTNMKKHIGTCDGRWRRLDLDVVVPSDTRELEGFVMLQTNTGSAQGAVHDVRAEIDVTNTAGTVVRQELLQNGEFGSGSNMSSSMNKQHPEPWFFWTAAQNDSTWGRVVPWKVRPMQ
jgi:hypothetical protein